ncbi:filamentous hemagglutinin N-terminal domain-containing protein [Haloferula sp.]|uniref:two-partner secretion domain-containing protein n=1 Tax=Haloferula sp. TaxID=2497595 RepID=UPI00329E1E8B
MFRKLPVTHPLALGASLAGCLIILSVADAQIAFDGSLGAGGAFTGTTIPADRGTTAGANLFHSFSDFNVGTGQSIHFETSPLTQNVLARVSGSSVSQINGILGTQTSAGMPSSANLFLVNPNGIMFGKGAKIDVAGSFTATTANYLSFQDEGGSEVGRFYASGDSNVAMLTPSPSAFGFLESSSEGTIGLRLDNLNELNDYARGHVALVGRQLDVRDSYLSHENGGMVLQALQQGEVGIGESLSSDLSSLQNSAINLTNVFLETPNGQEVRIESQGDLNLKDGMLESVTNNEGIDNHGQVLIQGAGNVEFDDFTVSVINRGTGTGGEISVNAGGDLRITNSGHLRTGYAAGGSGPGISINTGGSLRVDRFGTISSDSRIGGSGGAITLDVAGSTSIEDFGLILSTAAGSATGGKITLDTAELFIGGPSEIMPPDQTPAMGRTTGIESITDGPGFGGSIEVNVVGDARLHNSGGIYTSTNDVGTSGNIHLRSANLEIMGIRNFMPGEEDMRPNGFFITGISNKRTRSNFTGSLGSIDVEVEGNISLIQGGLIDASNFSLNSSAVSGDVTVTADNIFADRGDSEYFTGIGSGAIADESLDINDGGRGGTVTVHARSIELHNGAQISASSRSGGDAGLVEVFTNRLIATGAGPITPFVFTGESGVVSATRGSSTGDAGGVYIGEYSTADTMLDRPIIHLNDRAEIGARADGSGDGGSVVVDFPNGSVILDGNSTITARSGELEGSSGSVSVTARRLAINDSTISTTNAALQATGGDAGDVNLFPEILTINGGRVQVSALGGDAGDLTIEGARLIDLIDAELVAEAFFDGGSILISDTVALVLDRSLISANAINGTGGNIEVEAMAFLTDSSQVTASSEFGIDGVVQIDQSFALTGAESHMEVSALDPNDQIQPECTERLDTKAGSFIQSGRGGSARLPGGYLPSVRLHRIN